MLYLRRMTAFTVGSGEESIVIHAVEVIDSETRRTGKKSLTLNNRLMNSLSSIRIEMPNLGKGMNFDRWKKSIQIDFWRFHLVSSCEHHT